MQYKDKTKNEPYPKMMPSIYVEDEDEDDCT